MKSKEQQTADGGLKVEIELTPQEVKALDESFAKLRAARLECEENFKHFQEWAKEADKKTAELMARAERLNARADRILGKPKQHKCKIIPFPMGEA